MDEGLYESLWTSALQARIQGFGDVRADLGAIDASEQPRVLARFLSERLELLLRSMPPKQRTALTNDMLAQIEAQHEHVVEPVQQLLRVVGDELGHEARYATRPSTPLNDAALLTNASGEPSVGSEIDREIRSADHVDLLCAFVKWSGLRLLEDTLADLHRRGGRFRVITTTYIGATQRAALDRLARQFGADVRVNLDESRTRLHAKAWHFHRNSGYDTAYVGSSNLSTAALLDGLEWNVRLSRSTMPQLLEKFSATFDTYWNDPAFLAYDPDDAGIRDRVDVALRVARGGTNDVPHGRLTLSGLDIRPYFYQQRILDALEAQRSLHDEHRNLIVAATGTGKTVVAALDYRRMCGSQRPSLLFVAHRKEILEQCLRTYREVLRDPTFGELYVDGARPTRWDHVFASVQSLGSLDVRTLPPDHFDVIVIDEFHHAAAASYRSLLEHCTPREWLGMTATPERGDGFDVRALFGGKLAAELRIWEALEQGVLCPFHYFMVSDGTDLSHVQWRRGRYDDAELSTLLTGNRARTRVILQQLADKVINVHGMKALGFCVGIAHAEYMAEVFRGAGIRADFLSGAMPTETRERILAQLRNGELAIVFAADLLNEGVDIPDIDTILFLRPTESATIFLQQLGRGLRPHPNKEVLTVLDFVGNQREEFRFDQRLSALTGRSRRQLADDVDQHFPFLPSGCQIVLDEVVQQVVMRNLRSQLSLRWKQLVAELEHLPRVRTLAGFLESSGLGLPDVLRGKDQTWTALQRAAQRDVPPPGSRESHLSGRARALRHVDDPERARAYTELLRDPAAPVDQRLAAMLYFSLWPDRGGFDDPRTGLAALSTEPALRTELGEVVDFAFNHAQRVTTPLMGPRLDGLPLRVHARYQREEILAGLGWTDDGRAPNAFREGVAYLRDRNIDVLFITLRKTDTRFSPTTMYRDYPMSRTLFHWESQSTTTIQSPTGQRYIHGSSTVLLFVREQRTDDLGTSPYVCLGPATYVEHRGERPIAITWQLATPIPADLFAAWSVAASA